MVRPASGRRIPSGLLAALLPADLSLLEPHLRPVTLPFRQMLEKPNEPTDCLYIIESGIASVARAGASKTEIGWIGFEGMSGLPVILADGQSPHAVYMQLAGDGQRITASNMRAVLASSESLRSVFLRYAYAFTIQIAHTALANSKANMGQRLARVLLMAHDRVEGDDIGLTQEILALMVGIRRPGVTEAIHALAALELIAHKRGEVSVLDRHGLEAFAGSFYGTPEAEYRRLLC